ncbi:MAG: hypothetical protein ACYC7L_17550 [Nitrospirota bacterium]
MIESTMIGFEIFKRLFSVKPTEAELKRYPGLTTFSLALASWTAIWCNKLTNDACEKNRRALTKKIQNMFCFM